MTTPLRLPAAACLLAALFAWTTVAPAQGPAKPKDDALDSLLEKLDDAKPPAPEAGPAKPKAAEPAADKPSGDVETKDKALDSLLEKLGETPEAPAPEERRPGGPGSDDQPPPSQGQKPSPNELTGKTKQLDEHLEELTGRKRKKKQQEGEGTGPLADLIKQMREVEERLGKPDTSEETRKKQAAIVKQLEKIIEQLRAESSNPSSKKRRMLAMKPQQPGAKPGSEQAGAQAGGAPNSKPEKPTNRHSMAGGKDEWGHLPAELRQEMDNVAKEAALQKYSELIRLYYLSLSKKTLVRGE